MAAALVAVSSLCACSSFDPLRLWGPRPPPAAALGFHRWQQKSVHNAYNQRESLQEQLGLHRFRSVEIDIHQGKRGHPSLPGEWYVYHVDFPGFDGTSCPTLGACLGQIDAWHLANPGHEVLTVFLDVKDAPRAPGHDPAALDARVEGALAPGALFRPADLLARCPGATSLRQAVGGACGWPSLGELQGKIAVVITGGDVCSGSSAVLAYVGGDAGGRAAFVAPDVSASCPFELHAQRAPYAVVFNLDLGSLVAAPKIAREGLISRVYQGGFAGGLDDPDSWAEARANGAQFLATDRVDEARFPWTE